LKHGAGYEKKRKNAKTKSSLLDVRESQMNFCFNEKYSTSTYKRLEQAVTENTRGEKLGTK
jgi:hypothetical protein